MCLVADQTCKNMPTTILKVAVVRNITGICQVNTWRKLGCRRPVFFERERSPLVFANRFRIFSHPSRWAESRCRRTVWSAAVRMLNRERMMPQYQEVRTGHGDRCPLGRILGQLPVEVRTPARSADYGWTVSKTSIPITTFIHDLSWPMCEIIKSNELHLNTKCGIQNEGRYIPQHPRNWAHLICCLSSAQLVRLSHQGPGCWAKSRLGRRLTGQVRRCHHQKIVEISTSYLYSLYSKLAHSHWKFHPA